LDFFELVQRLRNIKYIYDDDGDEYEYELGEEEEKEGQEAETQEIVLWEDDDEDEEEDEEEEEDYKEEVGGSQVGTGSLLPVTYKDFHSSKAPTSAFLFGHCPRFMKAK